MCGKHHMSSFFSPNSIFLLFHLWETVFKLQFGAVCLTLLGSSEKVGGGDLLLQSQADSTWWCYLSIYHQKVTLIVWPLLAVVDLNDRIVRMPAVLCFHATSNIWRAALLLCTAPPCFHTAGLQRTTEHGFSSQEVSGSLCTAEAGTSVGSLKKLRFRYWRFVWAENVIP